MKHLGLFEGIGGFSLAARWMGWETVAWCEINPFCQKVLKHHFPKADQLTDITKTDFKKYANRIDIITGGFPCQSFSLAGKGAVDLSLWKEMYRSIKEVKPAWVVAENVPGIIGRKLSMAFETVCSDLENQGYEVQTFSIPIAGKGAPHKRERIWFVAYAKSFDRNLSKTAGNGEESTYINGASGKRITTDTNSEGFSFGIQRGIGSLQKETGALQGGESTRTFTAIDWKEFPTQSPICIRDDGFSSRLDGITFSKWRAESIKAGGNALSPHIAFEIFKAIEKYNSLPLV